MSQHLESARLVKEQFEAIYNEPAVVKGVSEPFTQLLTHRKIMGTFTILSVSKKKSFHEYKWVKIPALSSMAFPRMTSSYLADFSSIEIIF